MIASCMKDEVGFGIVLIEGGDQVLKAPEQQLPSVADCGTYCTIVDFDQRKNGVLEITVEGQVKFLVRDQSENSNRLMLAQVEFLPLEDETNVPADKQHLIDMLRDVIRHPQLQGLQLSIDFNSAREVGARLTEMLPLPQQFKQQMLKLKDPLVRLSELEKQLLRMQRR